MGYVSPNFGGTINELNQEESAKFINALFNRQEKKGLSLLIIKWCSIKSQSKISTTHLVQKKASIWSV